MPSLEHEAEDPEEQPPQEVEPAAGAPLPEVLLVPERLPAIAVEHDGMAQPAAQRAASRRFVVVEAAALRGGLAGSGARVRTLHLWYSHRLRLGSIGKAML